jgi:hypothetical protein
MTANLFMGNVVIDRFQEIGSRLCTSHLNPPKEIQFSHDELSF